MTISPRMGCERMVHSSGKRIVGGDWGVTLSDANDGTEDKPGDAPRPKVVARGGRFSARVEVRRPAETLRIVTLSRSKGDGG